MSTNLKVALRLHVLTILCYLIINQSLIAQKKQAYKPRLVQFSLAPGLGTNGIHPGSYINSFSLNLTSGYSAANYGLELAGISNLNTDYTKGLQFSGLFNLTGGNAFAVLNKKQIKEKLQDGFEANLEGVQFSGLGNIVVNNVFGGQLSGGINYVNGGLFGLQIAGVGNTVNKYGFAFQVAGIYNLIGSSLDGVQLSTLYNYVGSRLQGLQIGAFNRAKVIDGRKSHDYSGYTGVQIGLINSTAKMNGLQVGLINLGGQTQGTQIGLINFYRGGKKVNTKDGTSFGLINIGNSYEVLVYADELFFTNYQITSGTLKNARKRSDTKWVYIQNGIVFGYNPDLFNEDGAKWVLGYSINKRLFKRAQDPATNSKWFISYGFEFLHYNEGSGLDDQLNLLSRIKSSAGIRIHPKLSNIYLFGGFSYNLLLSGEFIDIDVGLFNERRASSDLNNERWLGGQIGLIIH